MKSGDAATVNEGNGNELMIEQIDYIPYIPGILWAVDKELRYLDIDGEKLKDWNLSKQDLIGKNVQEFHHEQANGMNTTHHRLAFEQGSINYRVEFGASCII
ncbi:hypothetical protein [Planococcus sp. ISL-109]|uniref:hypothetical protein n=1 Tax=Planococcus sp. ISL-109 TaxID=2819166 RepID=UPI001BEB1F6E|nr:hypothetical protein [Planococcus sp. ISL-109]MBT2583450.1 hypothetical protein [Planococcus sp. ISL-109]